MMKPLFTDPTFAKRMAELEAHRIAFHLPSIEFRTTPVKPKETAVKPSSSTEMRLLSSMYSY
jgi:hypothetical protein